MARACRPRCGGEPSYRDRHEGPLVRVDVEMCGRAWISCYAVAAVGGAVGWARDDVLGLRGRVGLPGMQSRGQARYGLLAGLLT